MVLPEHVEQFVVGELGRIVVHFHGFRMPGAVGADFLVGGVGRLAAGITDTGGDDSRQLAKRGFYSPETTCGKCGFGHDEPRLNCSVLLDAWSASKWQNRCFGGGDRTNGP